MPSDKKPHTVAVIGSGNWGSTIAKILAENTASHPELFTPKVQMWVFEEQIQIPSDSPHYKRYGDKSQNLTEVINEVHENIKYLPGIKLPENVVANPDLGDAVKDATILVFNLPHQFIEKTLSQMQGKCLPYARAISCVKGVDVSDGTVTLFSELIMEKLGIYCGSLSGANIAPEVAAEKFSETTIGYDAPPMDLKAEDGSPSENRIKVDEQRQAKTKPTSVKLKRVPKELVTVDGELLRTLFGRPYFHVNVLQDVAGVALSGALKNVVALASGFVAGKEWGENGKAAVIRVGILEMVKFGRTWFPRSVDEKTFTEESAGIADLVASCSAGRNFRCAKHAVEKGVSVDEIEQTEMNGQKLQGTSTARSVHEFLEKHGKVDDFPLFSAVYGILEGSTSVDSLPKLLDKRFS
ncbi:NAD-dependent glycerol-3-phosphate dehydrogenase N-terminus-domain-containing protein [Aspergillus avenaceus]|uniref:Glycerol-3-phosphate dehydrogenase [NAD(+)] n=1 Tax=Aspergillus avenaceus TaxID=36643 RepID=A0A5N6TSZ1_ASPAV|nr:NAD-dependent glycerol-3-phosphate dehydrogenase N-terminus-domain-containing protein [Aspergillus avenaceus]